MDPLAKDLDEGRVPFKTRMRGIGAIAGSLQWPLSPGLLGGMMQEGDSDHDSDGVAGPELIRQNIMTRMKLPDLIWPVGFDPTEEPQGYV